MPYNAQSLSAQFRQIFGKRIKSRRRELSHTQMELSAAVGISRTALANIEAGNQRTSVFLLARLAQALKIHPGDLIPEVFEAEQCLQQARRTSIPTGGKAELLTRELQKLNISVDRDGDLKSAIKEVQNQHMKPTPHKTRKPT